MIPRISRVTSALLLIAVALFAEAQQTQDKPKGTGSVSGIVVNSVDGTPIKGANIYLHGPEREGSKSFADFERYSARSAADGSFELTGLSAGRYSGHISKPGYSGVLTKTSRRATPGVALSLSDGQKIAGEVFQLVPSAAISGRIVDEEGEPVQGVQVDARKWTFSNGKRTLQGRGGRVFDAMTDDRGEYRLYGLLPGRYYVAVTPMWASESPAGRLVKTYYPSSRTIEDATPIVLAPGEEVRADFTLARLPGVKVKGTLTGAVVESKQSGEFVIEFRGEESSTPLMTGPKTDGSFELETVTPGTYEVVVSAIEFSDERTGPKEVARTKIEVPAGGLENLRIGVVPPSSEKGELQGAVASGEEGFRAGGWFVFLEPSDPPIEEERRMNTHAYAHTKPDGTFKMNAPEAGQYYLRAFQRGVGPRDDWYISSIEFNGRENSSRPLALAANATGQIRINMSSRSAALEGTVVDAEGKPSPQAQVLILPSDGSKRPDLYKTSQADQNGRFKMRGIVPYRYAVVALSDVDSEAAADPKFAKTLASRGTPIRFDPGGHQTIALKVTADAPQQ